MNDYQTQLSTYDATSVTVRGHDLTEDLMGESDFGSTTYLMLSGSPAENGEGRLVNAMLASLMIHGVTPHALAARLTYLSEPDSIQGAVASGLLGVGTRYVGAMQECSEVLQTAATEVDNTSENVEPVAEAVVSEYREGGAPFPGIGHPFHTPVDPRAQRLFELAETESFAGQHTAILGAIQTSFEDRTGKDLPINVTGAIAAVCSDIGLSPEAARGIAVISRATGLVAELLEEQANPLAADLWHTAQEHTTYVGEETR